MELTDLQITAIRNSHSEHMFASPVSAVDEGSFYRIAGTYILDKCRIRKVERADNKVTVRMKDGDVVLTVMEK